MRWNAREVERGFKSLSWLYLHLYVTVSNSLNLVRKICHNRLYSVYQMKENKIDQHGFLKLKQGQVNMSLDQNEGCTFVSNQKCTVYI